MGVSNLIFLLVFIAANTLFIKNLRIIIANIKSGRKIDRSDRKSERWRNMFRVALGQSKMNRRPIAGVLHFFVYIGFLIINIEVIEILVDVKED